MVRLGINKNIVALKNPARGRALNMAEGKGIEPLSVRIARGSSPLCHLDATL
jgi:hypothetical protein